MKGFIEIKEDSYDDTMEHLNRIKGIVCKLIKSLSEYSEDSSEEESYSHAYNGERMSRSRYRNRYDY